MFQRKYRLPASIRLFHSKTMHTPYFVLKIARNNLSYNRYGFIVGKKIDKRAVGRNRLKRRFRAGVETLSHELASGYDILFLLKKEAAEQTTEVLWNEIRYVFDQGRTLRNL